MIEKRERGNKERDKAEGSVCMCVREREEKEEEEEERRDRKSCFPVLIYVHNHIPLI